VRKSISIMRPAIRNEPVPIDPDFATRRSARSPGGSRQEQIDVRAVRTELRKFENRSTALTILLFLADAAVYALCFFWLAWLPGNRILKASLSVVLGIHITRFFVLGHDAAHGSLTASRALNGIIGCIALLPTLHPFSLWQLGHNRVHHPFTNLKGIDFIWIPFSPDEYRRLPAWRRALERFYHSVPGLGFYYLFEIWWKYLSPKGISALSGRRAGYYFDVALVLAFAVLQIFAAPRAVVLTTIIPFLVWNWLMGFIIYNHHTHPSVRFFQKRSEWRLTEQQVQRPFTLYFRVRRAFS
jgi:omega-6 fatty acid desaturase (delta-12 desaturase)